MHDDPRPHRRTNPWLRFLIVLGAIIVALILLNLITDDDESVAPENTSDNVAAIVNGVEIRNETITAAMITANLIEGPAADQFATAEGTLDYSIRMESLHQEAGRRGLLPAGAEVEAALASAPPQPLPPDERHQDNIEAALATLASELRDEADVVILTH